MTQGFGGFLLLLGGSCGEGAGCRAGTGPQFRCVLLSEIITKIKNIKLNKNQKDPELLVCSWHLCSELETNFITLYLVQINIHCCGK